MPHPVFIVNCLKLHKLYACTIKIIEQNNVFNNFNYTCDFKCLEHITAIKSSSINVQAYASTCNKNLYKKNSL